ncbi:MAG: TonB-dependent receptor [Rudaea sp.]|uniref:TonB-dependent receptor n=1 Tax=Rudaea sp. TaxID=2136325 RepID=UPI0039E548D6
MFALPSGNARASFGVGWREVAFEQKNLITGNGSVPEVTNSDRYVYSEISLPVLTKLSFNGALRYDDYSTFGGTTNPKIGAIWNVTPSLDIRANWGKSFKAPTLTQQYGASSVAVYKASAVGIAGAPSDATVLAASGANPDLAPERADVTTAGIAFHPQFLPDATVELGWFDIDYVRPSPCRSRETSTRQLDTELCVLAVPNQSTR